MPSEPQLEPLEGADPAASRVPHLAASRVHHLPRIALVFALLRSLQRFGLPLLAVLFVSRGQGSELILLVLLLPSLAFAFFRYFTYTYELGHEDLVIRSGFFFRQERHIPYARIQNIDLRQNLLHRLAKVAVVRLETGSGGAAEAEIEVLADAAIAELRASVFRQPIADSPAGANAESPLPASREIPARPDPDQQTLLELGPGDLVLRGLLTGRGYLLLVAIFGLVQQFDFWNVTGGSPEEIARFADQFSRFGKTAGSDLLTLRTLALGLLLLLLLLVATRLLSILWTLTTFWAFRLRRRGEDLTTEQGLITRVSATLPRHRIQALELRIGFLDGLFGRASLIAATAGRGMSQEDNKNPAAENAELFLAPIVRRDAAETLLQRLAPEFFEDELDWQGLAAGTLARLLRRRLLLALPFALALYYFFGPATLLPIALFAAGLYFEASFYVARSKWALGSHALFWRTGVFSSVSKIVPLEKIQVVVQQGSPFDRRRGTATLLVDTAATGNGKSTLVLPYLDANVAGDLARRLEKETGRRSFRW